MEYTYTELNQIKQFVVGKYLALRGNKKRVKEERFWKKQEEKVNEMIENRVSKVLGITFPTPEIEDQPDTEEPAPEARKPEEPKEPEQKKQPANQIPKEPVKKQIPKEEKHKKIPSQGGGGKLFD